MERMKNHSIWITMSMLLVVLMSSAGLVWAQGGPIHPDKKALKKILSDFEAYAVTSMETWKTPGMAIAVVRDDEVIYAKGFGLRTLGESEPVDTETVFQIGSTTKAFTTALVAQMVDEGHLHWTDKVVDHLPFFRMSDPWVTSQFEVRDLMAQRSGLAPQAATHQPFLGYNREEVMLSTRFLKPISSFRSEFAYVNVLFLWAAALVEKYTGQTWEESLREKLFVPLGMADSSAIMEQYVKSPNRASLYRYDESLLSGKIRRLPPSWPYFDWVYTMGPAGSIGSNVEDMTCWLRLLLAGGEFEGRRIISQENLFYTFKPQTIISAPLTGEQAFYGLGWVFNSYRPYPIIWHNGGTLGAKTIVSMIPEARLGIVVLTNLADTLLPEALHKYFYDLYFGRPVRDWNAEEIKVARTQAEADRPPDPPSSVQSPRPAEVYAGMYYNEAYGQIVVEENGGSLTIVVGPRQLRLPLKAWNGDIFVLSIPELMDWGEFVRFQFDPDGRPESVTVDMFDVSGTGTFYRIDD